ncbi:GNAT family N-acetyltransferase [Jiangella sp. DSM 45060]|uniref:GNAT family N-acetyltransferase n=1 Tax=Jiangella sp. DSM 45060 TaxID=1798224 RepID=UPI000B80F9CF|nr:GNAT family N-acetyltransferase [Jiangella sp. DSM 45060]
MTILARADAYVDAVVGLLNRVAAENVMDLDADKECRLVQAYARAVQRGTDPGLPRYAILADDGTVIGYLSGRFSGGLPGRDLSVDEQAAFVSMVVVAKEARGLHHGPNAVRDFAQLARSDAGPDWPSS